LAFVRVLCRSSYMPRAVPPTALKTTFFATVLLLLCIWFRRGADLKTGNSKLSAPATERTKVSYNG